MEKFTNASELNQNAHVCARMIYAEDLLMYPQLAQYQEKYLQDTMYTIRFLSISLDMNESLLFVTYMTWFGQLAYYLKFNLSSMKQHFDVTTQVLRQLLSSDFYKQVSHFYMLGTQAFEIAFQSVIPAQNKIDTFLNHLIHMRSDDAYQYVIDKIENGMTLKEVYLNLIQPTMYQVGDLWQQRKISVAKEHYITAAIQHIIGKLYPILFTNKKHGKYTMTAVCAGDELHEIGMRMVADFFEISGWDSTFLGSNLPTHLIVEQLLEHPTDLLAISATTSSQLNDIRDLITMVRNHKQLQKVRIIVGGKVFNETPNLWKTVGSDGYALDPEQAVLMSELLVGESHV